jgi:branched-chain amino acid transport system permease protein
MRWQTFKDWYRDTRQWYKNTRYEWSGDKALDKQRAKERRIVGL